LGGRIGRREHLRYNVLRRRRNPLYLQGVSRSATLPNVRTPCLRRRLPVIIRRVRRGEAKLVANVPKLGEFLALSPDAVNDLVSLLSGPMPERARPTRKKIDYVALRAQYEQLLLDGTCVTKADIARRFGVSRARMRPHQQHLVKNSVCSHQGSHEHSLREI
jgi:hypothetical protein